MGSSKAPSFFSSVLGTNYNIWNGISSKLEAAINKSLDVIDPTSSLRSDIGSERSPPFRQGDTLTSQQEQAFRTKRVSQFVVDSQQYAQRYKLKPGRKDRSIYGQPEIEEAILIKSKAHRDSYQDSVGTNDSGNSNGCTSSAFSQEIEKKTDPFLVFRHSESVGIGSETDTGGPSTSLDSSDVESLVEGGEMTRSESESSIHSWNSGSSSDSQGDEASVEARDFMKKFVEKMFKNSASVTYDEKAQFGKYSQMEMGRLWFARYVNAQRVANKKVKESTFYSLVQYFAIILFECAEADDFSPAKSLMNMCFTFYNEVTKEGQPLRKQYPYMYLKQQPIWKSLRFWNAAFFDAVQCERAHRTIPTRNDYNGYGLEELSDEKKFQENITFGQLGTFTCNMHAFDINRDLCNEFLRKQCVIANLPKEQVSLLRENLDRMFAENFSN